MEEHSSQSHKIIQAVDRVMKHFRNLNQAWKKDQKAKNMVDNDCYIQSRGWLLESEPSIWRPYLSISTYK
jgi:hypothetical protein